MATPDCPTCGLPTHPFSVQTLFLDPDASDPEELRDERPGSTLHCWNAEDHVFVLTADRDLIPTPT